MYMCEHAYLRCTNRSRRRHVRWPRVTAKLEQCLSSVQKTPWLTSRALDVHCSALLLLAASCLATAPQKSWWLHQDVHLDLRSYHPRRPSSLEERRLGFLDLAFETLRQDFRPMSLATWHI